MTNGTNAHPYPSAARRIEPEPGQESAWDYPKPPAYEPVSERVQVQFGGRVIADTTRAVRALQTGIPPVYYIPLSDVRMEHVSRTDRHSNCPYKGDADYWTVTVGLRTATNSAWSYPAPLPAAESIQNHLAFYAHAMDSCLVGDEQATPPSWKWIGGWVTTKVVGPFLAQADLAAG